MAKSEGFCDCGSLQSLALRFAGMDFRAVVYPRLMRVRAWAAVALVCGLGVAGSTQAGFTLPAALNHWMAIPADLDGDGNEEILMTTMDRGKTEVLTPPTPVYVIGVAEGVVVDRSPDLFDGPAPTSFSAKATVGDFDGDGKLDILICDRGRQAGTRPGYGMAGTLGSWRGQNQVLLQRGGRFVKQPPPVYPEVIADNWGCSAGDVDRSGRDTITINTFGPVPNYTAAYLLKWDGAQFVAGASLARFDRVNGGPAWGWSAMADFDKNGYVDIVGAHRVFWSQANTTLAQQPTDTPLVKLLPASRAEEAGYTFIRGSLTADLSGDGVPDLVKVGSLDAPTYAGARFALYESDGKGALTEKLDAFPALEAYNDSDFGNELAAIDINFDGFLDITTFGAVYAFTSFSGPGDQRPPTAVWLNNGTGRFTFAHWTDAVTSNFAGCPTWESYFLKTPDPSVVNLVVGGCGRGYVTRSVTADSPLSFAP